MSKTTTKTGAILMLISFVTWQVLAKFFPVSLRLIEYSLVSLFAFSIVLFVIAVLKESKRLSFISHYWSSVCLPIFTAQLLGVDYITQFVPIENLIWIALVYVVILPFIVSGLAVFQSLVCMYASSDLLKDS